MKRLMLPFLFSAAPLLGGCGPFATMPAPSLDATPTTESETATFALG
jgi:hypothetical protein